MAAKPVLMVMGTEPPPGLEEEWSRWYSEKHIPDIMKFKGVKKAARYKIRPGQLAPAKGETAAEYPRYLAIYEWENWEAVEAYNAWPGREAILNDWNENWAPKGAQIKWRIFYEPIKTWKK